MFSTSFNRLRMKSSSIDIKCLINIVHEYHVLILEYYFDNFIIVCLEKCILGLCNVHFVNYT